MLPRCELHGSPASCPYCEWAASGDPVKIRSAAARADRVAGRTPTPSDHIADASNMVLPTPGLARSLAVQRLARACPARYKDSCGCAEPFRCVLRHGGRVTEADCGKCLESRNVELPPR